MRKFILTIEDVLIFFLLLAVFGALIFGIGLFTWSTFVVLFYGPSGALHLFGSGPLITFLGGSVGFALGYLGYRRMKRFRRRVAPNRAYSDRYLAAWKNFWAPPACPPEPAGRRRGEKR